MLVSMAAMVYTFAGRLFLEHYADSIGKIIEVTAFELDLTPEELKTYAMTGETDAHYRSIRTQMNEIRVMSELEYLYIIFPTGEDSAVWVFDASDVSDGSSAEKLAAPVLNYMGDDFAQVRSIYRTGEKSTRLQSSSTDLGELVSAYYPIKDEDGNTIAVLGADKSLDDIAEALGEKLLEITTRMVLLIAIGMFVLLLFVQFGVIRSIRKLRQGVQRMADGKLGVQIKSRRRDEIGDITRVFNRMSSNIESHIREVEELNNAYHKFVPSETFEILDKDSVVDIRLGDQVRTNLTVLSMEPEKFDELTCGMAAGELFRYINCILEKTVPAVMQEGGTIERFEKAGICSLYTGQVEAALKSAVSACGSMRRMGLALAAGIAQGPIIVGIAGHETRMDIISISEQTKISAFLMEIAGKYNASVLISETAAGQIPQLFERYHCRFLGYLKIEASDRIEGMIDVFDGDDAEDQKFKRMTKEMFDEGVRLFGEKDYSRARQAFIEVLKQYRKDAAAREYFYRCNQCLQEREHARIEYLERL